MLEFINRVHFIGIGGIGMSGIAKLLVERGMQVSGSDANDSPLLDVLRDLGATIYQGHHQDHAQGAELVVYSSAIGADNVERVYAQHHNIPTLRRSQILAELADAYSSLAVTGTHGKTTTSAMLISILRSAGRKPSFIVGGIECGAVTNASCAHPTNEKVGVNDQPIMVIEADESDASFLDLRPRHVVVTNIELEHTDHYKNIDQVVSTMRSFLERVHDEGVIIYNDDDQRLRDLVHSTGRKALGFSLVRPSADLFGSMTNDRRPLTFDLFIQGQPAGEMTLPTGGQHNVANALAAAALAFHCGCQISEIQEGLKNFRGVKRRYELLGEASGVKIFDDYAHHPTEIRAILSGLRAEANGRLWALFQPHRYSRFQALYDDFLKAFDQADQVVVLPVYSAFETNTDPEKRDAQAFASVLRTIRADSVHYAGTFRDARQFIRQQMHPGDVVVTLGAGDVYQLGKQLLEKPSHD